MTRFFLFFGAGDVDSGHELCHEKYGGTIWSLRPFCLGAAKQSAHYLDVAFEASLGAVVAHQPQVQYFDAASGRAVGLPWGRGHGALKKGGLVRLYVRPDLQAGTAARALPVVSDKAIPSLCQRQSRATTIALKWAFGKTGCKNCQ